MERAGPQERCQTTRNGPSLPVSHSGRSSKCKGVTPPPPLVPWHSRGLQCLPSAPWQGTGSSFQKRPQESTGTEKAVFPRGEVIQAGPYLQWELILKLRYSLKWLAKICVLIPQQKFPFSLFLLLASMIGTNCSSFLFASACQQHEESQAITLSPPTAPVNLLYQRRANP